MVRKKNPFVHMRLSNSKIKSKKIIRTWSRRTTILPSFVGKTFLVHNGRTFIPVNITEEIVFYKLGSFARTRKRGLDPRPKTPRRNRK